MKPWYQMYRHSSLPQENKCKIQFFMCVCICPMHIDSLHACNNICVGTNSITRSIHILTMFCEDVYRREYFYYVWNKLHKIWPTDYYAVDPIVSYFEECILMFFALPFFARYGSFTFYNIKRMLTSEVWCYENTFRKHLFWLSIKEYCYVRKSIVIQLFGVAKKYYRYILYDANPQ